MSDAGNRPLGSTVVFLFSTSVNGVPTNFDASPTPEVSVYKNSVTQTTTGVTLNLIFDSRVGMHQVVVDTSDAFYVAGDFQAVITAGTVGGVSMVGYQVGSFSLSVEESNLDKTTGAIPRGTVTTGASTTSLPTSALSIAGAAATGVVADQFKGRVVLFDGATTTAGLRGAASIITANTASNTPTLTVDPALPATAASGDLFSVI